MVKRTSSLVSTEAFRVRVLVGVLASPVVQLAGRPRDMGTIGGSSPPGTTGEGMSDERKARVLTSSLIPHPSSLIGRATRFGDGNRLLTAWSASLVGSTPTPSAGRRPVAGAPGWCNKQPGAPATGH